MRRLPFTEACRLLPCPVLRRNPGQERTISATLDRAITRIRRRARIRGALSAVPAAIAVAAFAWIALRFGVAFGASDGALGVAGLLLTAVVAVAAGVGAWRGAPTRAAAARELDRRLEARGRIVAAFELSRSSDPLARAAVADASSLVAGDSLRRRLPNLFPISVPDELRSALALVLLAPVASAALEGRAWRSPFRAPDATRPSIEAAIEASEREAGESTAALPEAAWIWRELARAMRESPAAAVRGRSLQGAIAAAPTPTPIAPRGSTILDPSARAWFDHVVSSTADGSVAREVQRAFTEEMASSGFRALVAEFNARSSASGARYELGTSAGSVSMAPPRSAPGGGITAPAVDPAKMKSDYLKDRTDLGSELASALKESFDAYLKEFAAEMLKGLEEALETRLSEKSGGPSTGGLPKSPAGLAERRGGHSASGSDVSTRGPAYAGRTRDGGAATASAAGGSAAGGTAAGGVGAGVGEGAGDGEAPIGTTAAIDAGASGDRQFLGGTLDRRLAVVEVVRRMSGGVDAIDDTASAEVVRASTKAAEAEAAAAEEIPAEYRGAVQSYFRSLSAGSAAAAAENEGQESFDGR